MQGISGWKLHDVVAYNRRFNFPYPTHEESTSIEIGMQAFVCFDHEDGRHDRLWVVVDRIMGDDSEFFYSGCIEYGSQETPGLQTGERVDFNPENVAKILWVDLDDANPEHE